MALAERLALLVEMNPQSAVAGLTKIGETAEKQLSKVDTKTAAIGKSMTRVGVGMIGIGAVIGGVLVEAAEKAGKAELAQIKLENSVRNSSNQAKGSAEEYEKLAKSIQSKTAASRIDIIAGEATLVQFGATTEQVKGLTPLVVDLARKQGLDLTQANKLVGKALEGSTGALKKAGIVVDDATFATDRYKAVVDALRKTVGGFAETEGKTFEGSIARLKNELTDIEAGVGKGAVDAFTNLLKPVEKLSNDFESLSPKTQESIGKVGAYSAAGLIAAGSTAILAGKILTAKDNLARFSDEMPRTAAGLGLVAKAGLVLAALSIGGQIAEAVDPGPAPANANKLAVSLLGLNKTGKLVGEGARVLGQDYGKLDKSIEQLTAPSNLTKVDKFFSGITGRLNFRTSTQGAKQVIDGLDQSLVALQSRDPAAATAALDAIRQKIGDKAFDRLQPLLHGYQSALAGVTLDSKTAVDPQSALAGAVTASGAAASSAAEDFVRLAGITGKNIDPVKELDSAIEGLEGTFLGLEGSQDAFQSGLNSLPEKIKAVTDKHEALKNVLTGTSDEYIALRSALRGQVDDGAKVIESLVQQGASSDVVKAKIAELSSEFETQATKAGLPQPVIDHYLATLQAIPGLITTTIDANTSAAAVKIDALIAREKVLRLGTSVDPKFPQLYGGTPLNGARAGGGGVQAGMRYLVGERGPEILTMGAMGGSITPNNAIGGTSVTHNWNVVLPNVQKPADFIRDLRTEVRKRGGIDKAFA